MTQPLPVIVAPPSMQPPAIRLDRRTYAQAMSCVHCGLCLPACPTYNQTGHEADSPRGRIQLMRGLADGTVPASPPVLRHLDLCLDCRACETACPSGVVYHELLEQTRTRLAEIRTDSTPDQRAMRWAFLNVLTRPNRLRAALVPARLLQKAGWYRALRNSPIMRAVPGPLAAMERLLPSAGSLWPRNPPRYTRARTPGGTRSGRPMRVALLTGCVGGVMFEQTTRKAIELLSACGADVYVPASQGCCGAIHHHNAAESEARELARINLAAFASSDGQMPDAIVTAVAGCGAMLREYGRLLRDDPASPAARAFSARVGDITQVIAKLGLPQKLHRVPLHISYHDACHLAHAQKVTAEPRQLLADVPGLSITPLPESDMCCGAAGTYNLTQPEMASSLADRKLAALDSTEADVCVTGNAGCALHIAARAADTNRPLKVLHTIDILHAAVFGSNPLS